jgi:hypothetical protein
MKSTPLQEVRFIRVAKLNAMGEPREEGAA